MPQSKKIYTIQSDNKNEFDKEVNFFLENGCELLEGTYNVFQLKNKTTYHQVVIFGKKWNVEFYNNGKIKHLGNVNTRGNGKSIDWYDNGQKKSEGEFKHNYKDGKWTEWYENGHKKS